MKIDFKARFRNKSFVAAFVSVIILLIQQLGLGEFLPKNIMEIVNTLLILLTMLGIIVDPSDEYLSDKKYID